MDPELGPLKRCPRCKEWWPADGEFWYPNAARPGGLQSECKACQIERRRAGRA